MTNPDNVMLATFPIDDGGCQGCCFGTFCGLPICCTGIQVKKSLFKGQYIGGLLLAQIRRNQPFPNGIDEIGVRR